MTRGIADGSRIRAMHGVAGARVARRRIAGLTLATVLAFAGSQLGCDKNQSPTAPAPPAAPTPAPPEAQYFLVGSGYAFDIRPVDGSNDPYAGELLVDEQQVWAGPLQIAAGLDPNFVWNVNVERPGSLSPGSHTFSIRLTAQGRTPTDYYIGGDIQLHWSNGTQGQFTTAGNWPNAAVRMKTGGSWTVDFVVPAAPGS